LLQSEFKLWLPKQPRFSDRHVYNKALPELQRQYPQLWEQFLRTGLSDDARSMMKRLDGMFRQHPRYTAKDPHKQTRYVRNTFVHGKPT
jgi:hypothetical protein